MCVMYETFLFSEDWFISHLNAFLIAGGAQMPLPIA